MGYTHFIEIFPSLVAFAFYDARLIAFEGRCYLTFKLILWRKQQSWANSDFLRVIGCLDSFSTGNTCQDLFAVVNTGKFYKRHPPQYASDNWLGTAKLIGGGGWTNFKHLFFHPDGTLYGVWGNKFYKLPPPISSSASARDWVTEATLVGSGGWDVFQFLFFHPSGILYAVTEGKFYRRLPPTHSQDNWVAWICRTGGNRWLERLQIPILRSPRDTARRRKRQVS